MNFCSEYGYDYGDQGSESECIEDDDEVTKQKVLKKIRKADTNIIAVNFDRLVIENEMFSGDYIQCKNCNAIMTAHSKIFIEKNLDGKTIWKCEFCENTNDISLRVSKTMHELPKDDDVTFLIEDPTDKQAEKNKSNEQNLSESNYLTLCIDVSGSMDTFIEIKKETETKMENGEPNYEYIRTETSRLDGIKMACLEATKALKETDPNKLVSLVTFSDHVKFFGDCSKSQKAIVDTFFKTKDILNNKEKLIALAKSQDGNIMPISKSYQNIEDKLKFLKTDNSTALGPGIMFAVVFSAKKAGSKVILCTDGCSNVGMGSIENTQLADAEKFYKEVAEYAIDNGVIINVISMKGTDCKLSILGKLADKTNGTLKIVNPLELGNEFKAILNNKIVATNVKAKLIVNKKYLYIRDCDLEFAEDKVNDTMSNEELNETKKSYQEKEIGNAMYDTEVTFEYGLRKFTESKSIKNKLKKIPFQLQVTYTTLEGRKAIRVYTKLQEFTKDRQKAESNTIDGKIVFSNASQKIGHFTLEDSVNSARFCSMGVERLSQQNNWDEPLVYKNKAKMALCNNKRFCDMTDKEATLMFCCNRKL